MANPAADTSATYDRAAIYNENGPFSPAFMREAIRTLMRSLPLDTGEPRAWQDRRMCAALLGLSALNPRDEIEVMLAVQAMSAYHAAAACWHIGMNLRRPNGDSTRHLSAACSAARTFDSLLRAIERRQAKPLSIPVGRPACREWDEPSPATLMQDVTERCRDEEEPAESAAPEEPAAVWAANDLVVADELGQRERTEKENEGLDLANTEGILPGGGMILMDDPTPQQAAYMGRRLGLMYKREYEEGLRSGVTKMPKIRPIRPGDLIP